MTNRDNAPWEALAHVLNERIAQREKWSEAHDDAHDITEWQHIIYGYVQRLPDVDEEAFVEDCAKIAATALAAIESMHRKKAALDIRNAVAAAEERRAPK